MKLLVVILSWVGVLSAGAQQNQAEPPVNCKEFNRLYLPGLLQDYTRYKSCLPTVMNAIDGAFPQQIVTKTVSLDREKMDLLARTLSAEIIKVLNFSRSPQEAFFNESGLITRKVLRAFFPTTEYKSVHLRFRSAVLSRKSRSQRVWPFSKSAVPEWVEENPGHEIRLNFESTADFDDGSRLTICQSLHSEPDPDPRGPGTESRWTSQRCHATYWNKKSDPGIVRPVNTIFNQVSHYDPNVNPEIGIRLDVKGCPMKLLDGHPGLVESNYATSISDVQKTPMPFWLFARIQTYDIPDDVNKKIWRQAYTCIKQEP